MFDLKKFKQSYETDITKLVIKDKEFSFFVPATIEPFLNPDNPMEGFPLWAKIWEASIVLAQFLAESSPRPGKTILEIGGGSGAVSIVGSSFGHNITLTEYDERALEFARANAALNNCKNLRIERLDWHNPNLSGKFDTIIGSEVIYNERDFQPITRIFETYLKPGGDIFLAESLRKTTLEFFHQMSSHYEIKAQKKIIRGPDQEIRVIFCRMTPKYPAE